MNSIETAFLEYGEKELSYLKGKDSALAKVIDEIGVIRREMRECLPRTPAIFLSGVE